MPMNINCITIIITLEGIEKTKTEKTRQQSGLRNICFTNTVRLKYLPDFD